MSETVGDLPAGTPLDLGHQAHLRLSRRRDQRDHGRVRSARATVTRPEFIQVRHEEMAAFMACAHAKFTGELGVCLATSGPGRDPPAERSLRRQARPPAGGRDRRPAGASRPRRQLPAGDRPPVACSRTSPTSSSRWRWCPAQIRHLVDRACRIALAERTVTALIIPNDLQEADAVAQPPHKHGTVHSGPGYERSAGDPRRRGPRSRRRGAERRRARWRCWSARARCTPPTRSPRSPRRSAPAWPRRCSARPCCPTTCPT